MSNDITGKSISKGSTNKRIKRVDIEIPKLKLPQNENFNNTISYSIQDKTDIYSNKENSNINIYLKKQLNQKAVSNKPHKFLLYISKQLFKPTKITRTQSYRSVKSISLSRSKSQSSRDNTHSCIYKLLLGKLIQNLKESMSKSYFGRQSVSIIQNTRYIQSISKEIPINNMRKSLMLSKPPLPEALSHRSNLLNIDNTPRFTNKAVNLAASVMYEHSHNELQLLPKNIMIEKNKKDKLWRYVFELQSQLMDLKIKLKESKEESALGVLMCSKIKDEAAILKQDLEHQIEELSKEVANKDLIIEELRRSHIEEEPKGNFSPRYLTQFHFPEEVSKAPSHKNQKSISIIKPRINDTMDISFEGPISINDKSMITQMDSSSVYEAIPEGQNTSCGFYEALHRLSVPPMDLKILLDRTEEDSQSMIKEMNSALQMYIRQLLDEKKEIAEIARKGLENSEEEKKLLEIKLQEISQYQKESIDVEEQAKIESDKKLLRERKAAFNKKLAKFKEMHEHLAKRETNLKEIDLKIRNKQKKLIMNKQELEEGWKELESQKLKLAIDVKEIEHEWNSVERLKKKLIKTSNKIKAIKQELQEQHEFTKQRTNDLEITLNECKARLLAKEKIRSWRNSLKQKEEEIQERERNLRKDREEVVSMRLRMKEELRQLNMQKRNLEDLKSELTLIK